MAKEVDMVFAMEYSIHDVDADRVEINDVGCWMLMQMNIGSMMIQWSIALTTTPTRS
jgi:hypothetical protein